MIRVTIITWLACIVFALYNALSIKQFTETRLWHTAQYMSIILFIFCGLETKVRSIFYLWKWKDFHNFGKESAKILVIFAGSVVLYVYGLHWFLIKVIEWMN